MIALDKNLSDYNFVHKTENDVRYYSHPHFYYDSPDLHLIERKSKKRKLENSSSINNLNSELPSMDLFFEPQHFFNQQEFGSHNSFNMGTHLNTFSNPIITGVEPSYGRVEGGEHIIISGNYFTKDLQCKFGNVLVSIMDIISDVRIICRAPPSAGLAPGPVLVTLQRWNLPIVTTLDYSVQYSYVDNTKMINQILSTISNTNFIENLQIIKQQPNNKIVEPSSNFTRKGDSILLESYALICFS